MKLKIKNYLKSEGFLLIKEEVYKKGDFQISIIEQRNNHREVWIKNGTGTNIRIDYLLEYHLSKSVSLTRSVRGRLNDADSFFNYVLSFLKKFLPTIIDTHNFDFDEHNKWLEVKEEVEKARQLIRL